MKLFRYLRIRRFFEYPLQDEYISKVNWLKNEKKKRINQEGAPNSYRIKARFSLGTLTMSGGFGYAINAYFKIKEIDGRQIVEISTGLRPEHILVMLLITLIVSIIDYKGLQIILFELGIFIVAHFWFHFVYRVQENYLINDLISDLSLNEIQFE